RSRAILTYFSSLSIPRYRRPHPFAARSVCPDPQKLSSTGSPAWLNVLISCSARVKGKTAGWSTPGSSLPTFATITSGMRAMPCPLPKDSTHRCQAVFSLNPFSANLMSPLKPSLSDSLPHALRSQYGCGDLLNQRTLSHVRRGLLRLPSGGALGLNQISSSHSCQPDSRNANRVRST